MELTPAYMRETSDCINEFIQSDNWDQAEELLLKNIDLFPDEYWLYTTLSEIYSGKREYEKAFIYSKKAMEMNSTDILVIYNYAEGLLRFDKTWEAIKLFNRIINTDIEVIAYGKYGEGMKYAKSKINDSIALLGYAYYDLKDNKRAQKYFTQHLENRKRGIYSDFRKKQIEKAFRRCLEDCKKRRKKKVSEYSDKI